MKFAILFAVVLLAAACSAGKLSKDLIESFIKQMWTIKLQWKQKNK